MFIVHVSTSVTNFIVGFFVPVVTGLLTKSSATKLQKRLVLAALSAIGAIINTLATTNNSIVGWNDALNLFWIAIVAFGSYYGWWKGAPAFESLKARKANVGIGYSSNRRNALNR